MVQSAKAVRGEGIKAPTVTILNPLVNDIMAALLELGGAAHRDMVVALVAKKHGIFRPSSAMVEELEAAFSTYCRAASDPRSPGLLHLPYGPTSRRWALTDQAHDLLRAGLDPTGL